MSGYFRRLAARAMGTTPMLVPRAPSRFEAGGELPAWDEATIPADVSQRVMMEAGRPAGDGRALPPTSALTAAIPGIAPMGVASPVTLAAPSVMRAPVMDSPLRAARREAAAVPALAAPHEGPGEVPASAGGLVGIRGTATPETRDALPRDPTALSVAAHAGGTASPPALMHRAGSPDAMPGPPPGTSPLSPFATPPSHPASADSVFSPARHATSSPGGPRAAATAETAAPNTDISIGRVEIRFAAPPAAPAPPRAAGPPPLATLLATSRRARPS